MPIICDTVYSPNEVFGEEISDEEYRGFAKGIDVQYQNTMNDKWFIYCLMYCFDNGMDIYRANSFGHIVTLFVTGLGHSCGTDCFFKEEQIEYFGIDLINNIDSNKSDIERINFFFLEMFDLYDTLIEEYSIKNQRLQIRCSISMLEEFNNIDGATSSEKLSKLLILYKKYYKEV